jgi:hypothetical protein
MQPEDTFSFEGIKILLRPNSSDISGLSRTSSICQNYKMQIEMV